MAEPEIDWRPYENWLVPHVEARLFPEWSAKIHSDLLRIAQIDSSSLLEAEFRRMHESAISFLNGRIKSDNLLLFGRPDDPESEIELIRPNVMREVVEWSFQQIPYHSRSVVNFAIGQSHRTFYEVYVVPFLVAPGLTKRAQGRVDDLISYHLWMDVELQAAAGAEHWALVEWVRSQETTLEVRISDLIDDVSSDLTREIALSPISAGARIATVKVLADRLVRFFSMILSGECLIAGRRFSDGRLEILPAALMMSVDLSICLSSWRIINEREPAWREIRIVDPEGRLAPTLAVCDLVDGTAAAKARPFAPDQSAHALFDAAGERAWNRPQEMEARLPHIDLIVADLLITKRLPLATKTEFDQLCAQAWQSAGIPLGNDVRKGRKVPTDEKVNKKQIRSAGEWLHEHVPAIRAAIVGKNLREK